jgi:hypothetical protein
MESLAGSRKAARADEPPTQLRLTLAVSQKHVSSAAADAWSKGPVYRRLDSDFLEQPLIPKAPPTPRLLIDRDQASWRIDDRKPPADVSDAPTTLSEFEIDPADAPPRALAHAVLAAPTRRLRSARGRPALAYQAAAVAAGFAAGLIAAFLFGLL